MGDAEHWDRIYGNDPASLGWYEPTPATLARVLAESEPTSAVIDVGAGTSTLVDHLADRGYSDLTLVDLSAAALGVTRARLADRSDSDRVRVETVVADVADLDLDRRFDLWHDRAVFHFLIDPADRARYVAALDRSLADAGRVVIAVFAPEGPEMCAGLAVCRYRAAELAGEFAPGFSLLSHEMVTAEAQVGDRRPYMLATFGRRDR